MITTLVTKAFAANHKVVELNGNSFNVRKDGIPNMKALLAACLQNGCHIAVDSDAHSTLAAAPRADGSLRHAGGDELPARS